MIALATLNTTLERALPVARQPDKGRDARLTAHKGTRFAALTPDDFADVNHARVLDTYHFVSAHVALPCPIHGQPLDDEQVGQAIGDLAIETPKQALWFLVVVIAAVVLDGCKCPNAHGGALPTTPGRTRRGAASPDRVPLAMDGPARLPSERPSHKRGALVVFAVGADFAWIAVHIPALSAVGLADGDPRFYLAYQIGRCAIAAVAVGVAVRSGLFGRRELGLVGARHGAALCRLSRIVGIVALLGALLVGAALLIAPSATCDHAEQV